MTLKSFPGQLLPALVAGVGLALADASGLRIMDGTDLRRQSVRKRHWKQRVYFAGTGFVLCNVFSVLFGLRIKHPMSWALPMIWRIETHTPQGCILLILVCRQFPVRRNLPIHLHILLVLNELHRYGHHRGSVMFESGFHRIHPIFSASEAAGRSLVKPQAVHLTSHRPFTWQAAGRSLDKPQAVHLERR